MSSVYSNQCVSASRIDQFAQDVLGITLSEEELSTVHRRMVDSVGSGCERLFNPGDTHNALGSVRADIVYATVEIFFHGVKRVVFQDLRVCYAATVLHALRCQLRLIRSGGLEKLQRRPKLTMTARGASIVFPHGERIVFVYIDPPDAERRLSWGMKSD